MKKYTVSTPLTVRSAPNAHTMKRGLFLVGEKGFSILYSLNNPFRRLLFREQLRISSPPDSSILAPANQQTFFDNRRYDSMEIDIGIKGIVLYIFRDLHDVLYCYRREEHSLCITSDKAEMKNYIMAVIQEEWGQFDISKVACSYAESPYPDQTISLHKRTPMERMLGSGNIQNDLMKPLFKTPYKTVLAGIMSMLYVGLSPFLIPTVILVSVFLMGVALVRWLGTLLALCSRERRHQRAVDGMFLTTSAVILLVLAPFVPLLAVASFITKMVLTVKQQKSTPPVDEVCPSTSKPLESKRKPRWCFELPHFFYPSSKKEKEEPGARPVIPALG